MKAVRPRLFRQNVEAANTFEYLMMQFDQINRKFPSTTPERHAELAFSIFNGNPSDAKLTAQHTTTIHNIFMQAFDVCNRIQLHNQFINNNLFSFVFSNILQKQLLSKLHLQVSYCNRISIPSFFY